MKERSCGLHSTFIWIIGKHLRTGSTATDNIEPDKRSSPNKSLSTIMLKSLTPPSILDISVSFPDGYKGYY